MKLNEFSRFHPAAVKPDCLFNMDMLFILSVKYNIIQLFGEYRSEISFHIYKFKDCVWSAILDKVNETK